MSYPKVLLIFGAGPRIGLATIKKFSSEGYKVAVVSRNPSKELQEAADLVVPANLKDPEQIKPVFERVIQELGVPHVVIYNAFDNQITPITNPLTVSPTRLSETLAVNTISPYTAAVQAVKHWAPLPSDGTVAKTFCFTGNMLSTQVAPVTHVLGMGKSATAYWIEMAATAYNRTPSSDDDKVTENTESSTNDNTKGKAKSGGKFYYVDERRADGDSVFMDVNAEAHATEFWKLSEEIKEQTHWDWTFVAGTGYVRNKAHVDREYREFGLDFKGIPEEGGISVDEVKQRAAAGGKQE